MKLLADLVYLREHGIKEQRWVRVGKLMWEGISAQARVLLLGVPLAIEQNAMAHRTGVRLIGRVDNGKAGTAQQPYLQGDVFCSVATWENPEGIRRKEKMWCGFITSTESEDGAYTTYTLVLEVIPVVWRTENGGLWLEVQLDELQG